MLKYPTANIWIHVEIFSKKQPSYPAAPLCSIPYPLYFKKLWP